MAQLLDCPSCGGLIPSDRRCCPHCHCKTSLWKHWLLLISAALGLGAAGCDKTTFVAHYGGAMVGGGGGGGGVSGGGADLAVPDLAASPGDGGSSGNADGGQ